MMGLGNSQGNIIRSNSLMTYDRVIIFVCFIIEWSREPW